ncbi:Variable outer membrane protein (plasmid) [Borrelia crocidurae DOU]|uniref:Variable large protein n=1 Tax=Borrelia crocidurae DOU TaxID=1293575 RepID=W5SJN5_9SPIR|nr:variable large family protein [Borrelia crocidurae]AHH07115.1 Variable outer membrane protein [Borrelia crocidurae DOU]
MKREVKEGEIKGRRGIGRVKKMRIKGIILMMMIVMGCNSGGVKDPEKVFLSEMVNLGKGFLDVFVSFRDMITETLGIKADTKKSEIGVYFTKIDNTMKTVKGKLVKILEEHGSYEKVKEKIEGFIGKISKIEEGAKEAAKGANDGILIGNAVKNQAAVAANKEYVISLVKGIKAIVGIVLSEGEGSAEATKTSEDDKKNIGKLFSNTADDATEAEAAKASASIGSVSGADILKAIAKSKENPAVNNAEGIEKATAAAEIAVAPAVANKKEIKDDAKKDAVIAAGIALRGMAKDGRFAAKSNEDKSAHAMNGTVASAVNKVLSTLVIAIRNRVDEGLKGINEVLVEIKQGEGVGAKAN